MMDVMKQEKEMPVMEKLFRWLGWLEGGSMLLLLFVAMPMKYIGGEPLAVRVVGAAHGGLFMVYCAMAYWVATDNDWPSKTLLKAWILSVLPFGTFYFDYRHLRAGSSITM